MDLKPCPFCGRAPLATDGGERWSIVGCVNDECMATAEVFARTPAEAATRWNRREPAQNGTLVTAVLGEPK